MKILFITATRIGDAVLSTGLLDYLRETCPEAKITVACGPLPAPLFEGFTNVERVIPMKKRPRNGHWIDLWKAVIGTKWDMVVDLRNSAVSRLIFAKKRYIFGRHIDQDRHKVEQMADVMKLDDPPSPALYFTAAQMDFAQKLVNPIPGGLVLAIGPSANWIGKTWPADNFIKVMEWLTSKEGLMPGARVAVFAAPGEEAQAQPVLEAVPPNRRINGIAKGNPAEVAAAISLCDFYIGNDSGLLHCAAAADVPSLGLFGPSYPHLYAPWGDHAAYVQTPKNFDELIDFEGYSSKTTPSLMTGLSVQKVMDVLKGFDPLIQRVSGYFSRLG